MNIDMYDKRLLYELDKDSSISLSELAKKLKRSKQFVSYRMKRLEEDGIITGYHAIVDMSKLGYFTFRVYFKFQQMTEGDINSFIDYLKRRFNQIWTIASVHGKWDNAIFLGVRRILEFHEIWDGIMLEYKQNIRAYNVAVYAPIYNFNRRFFFEDAKDSVVRVYGAGEKEDIDENDWQIIRSYAANVRQSSLQVSEGMGVSSDTVRRRIKALEEKKVLVGYKLGLDLEKLGFVGYRLDIHLINTARNKEIFEYCKSHPYIYQVNKSIGGADFEMEAIVRDRQHLMKLMDDIKTRFKDVVSDIQYFGFSTFHILQYIPD